MNILIGTQILVWSFDVYSPLSKQHKEFAAVGKLAKFQNGAALNEAIENKQF